MEEYLITPEGLLVSSLSENEELSAIQYNGEDVETDILLIEKVIKRNNAI